MDPLTEEAFRELLDERGCMAQGKRNATGSFGSAPALERSYAVFSQSNDVRLEIGALRGQATRFFQSRIGLTVDKRYEDEGQPRQRRTDPDIARVVFASDDGLRSGTRLCYGRTTVADDVARAEDAERLSGARASGLGLLAKRCATIWLIVPESEDDRTALSIAAVFASSMLGPILTPGSTSDASGSAEIFGVRTARMKLEAQTSPYR